MKSLISLVVAITLSSASVMAAVPFVAALSMDSKNAGQNVVEGRTVAILDGDTITVLDAQNKEHRIRFSDIDAPEKNQPFGQRSKQSLSDLCYNKPTMVQVKDVDRYGRTVGRVSCNGADANLEQVKRGMAWAYHKYTQDMKILNAELTAQNEKVGLWSDPNPVRPDLWRHR